MSQLSLCLWYSPSCLQAGDIHWKQYPLCTCTQHYSKLIDWITHMSVVWRTIGPPARCFMVGSFTKFLTQGTVMTAFGQSNLNGCVTFTIHVRPNQEMLRHKINYRTVILHQTSAKKWCMGASCTGIWKSDSHLTNDLPFPGVLWCVIQLIGV